MTIEFDPSKMPPQAASVPLSDTQTTEYKVTYSKNATFEEGEWPKVYNKPIRAPKVIITSTQTNNDGR